MLVKEVMSRTVEWVDPALSIKDSAMRMRDRKIGCLPVEDNGKLVGMVTDRDITCRAVAEGWNPETTKVRDLMSKNVVTCYDDADVNEAAHIMEEKGIARLPVFSRENKLVGLLSLGDVSMHCSHELSGQVMEKVARHHH